MNSHVLGWFAVQVAVCSAIGCGRGAAASGPPDAGPSAASSSAGPHEVRVDGSLLDSGRIRLAQAERRALDSDLVVPGDVVAAEDGQAEVGVLVSGRIATLDVAEGARVTKGQVLARVDAPDVGRATAQLLLSRGRLAVAERKLARQLELEKQNATSRNAVDEARAEDRAARAELAAARTALRAAGAYEPRPADDNSPQTAGQAVSIRVPVLSPLAGIVVERSVALGSPVAPERTLFRIVDPDKLLVRAKLPETLMPLPETGVSAVVRPRGFGGVPVTTRCAAEIVTRFGAVDQASRTVPIRLLPEKPCPFLLPGAYVDVVMRRGLSHREGPQAAPNPVAPEALPIVVPVEAVVDVRGVPTVFVAGVTKGAFVPHAVRVGPTSGTLAVIESGLPAGVSVVVTGAVLLKGELVRGMLEGG